MQLQSPLHLELPQVPLKHGPIDFIGRVLLKAYRLARARGIRLRFASCDELVIVRQLNSESWKAIFTSFDPRCSQLSEDNSFCVIGENNQGEIVATGAARLFFWPATNLATELASLRALYANPEAEIARGEKWLVDAPLAETIRGRVMFTGAIWLRPDFRGKQLREIVPIFMRTYGLANWGPDVLCAVQELSLAARSAGVRSSYPNAQAGIRAYSTPFGDLDLALNWMTTLELLAMLDRFVVEDYAGSA